MMDAKALRQVFIRANEFKEGDLQLGGATEPVERKAARSTLARLRLADIAKADLVEDAVTEALKRSVNLRLQDQIAHLTVGEMKRLLLCSEGPSWIRRHMQGLTSEQIAAVVKLMSVEELSVVARAFFNPLSGEGVAIGSEIHFGSRIQPNSPGDDETEILFSVLEGLSYGCGDVIIGVNPASDDVETIIRLERLLQRIKERLSLPTRYCVLSDLIKQTTARARVPVEVGFQSLAGTSNALRGMIGMDIDGLLDLCRGFDGLYFETGQGSAVTNQAAEGVDMVTLESRNYGLARYIRNQTGAWMIVNDVAGFIGPEVFRSPEQLLRACLEDTVMAKLHGLCMGLDVCSTFHMGIDPATLRRLTREVVEKAAPAYLMAVAGNADPMLGYLTTSFREHPQLRIRCGKRISAPMHRRFVELGIMDSEANLNPHRPGAEVLYAQWEKNGGDKRPPGVLEAEGRKKTDLLRQRGFDLGYAHGPGFSAPADVISRLSAVYSQARQALYSTIDAAVVRDACPRSVHLRTQAKDRESYLSNPGLGERLCEEDTAKVAGLYSSARRPQIQVVISDGLNANAVNENLRAVLPRLRFLLSALGLHAGDIDLVLQNGRVRAGYQIGALLDVDAIVHLIGERPGTGRNTLSAYLTFGRDGSGKSRWSPLMDHANTTPVCGIHPLGKAPAAAADQIASCIKKIIEERRSGVELGKDFGLSPQGTVKGHP